ncbi:MAG TPA: hypothetical protein VI520_05525 [Anaerolineales bacterium]|nr:hypothetical protein [Anaerolineales bacterium]
MAGEIVPSEMSFAQWIEEVDLGDLADEAGELAEVAPYLKYVVGAYRWYRSFRARQFLRSLSSATQSFTSEQRQKFEQVIKSDIGSELLADYAEKVLRTSSRTAIAALALLYADVDDVTYSREFKRATMIALEGISEDRIDAFVELSQVDEFIPDKNLPNVPYPVAVANDKLIAALSPEARELLESPELRITIISDLIRRGLLMPDFASARLGDGGVGMTFGITQQTARLRSVILHARQLLSE